DPPGRARHPGNLSPRRPGEAAGGLRGGESGPRAGRNVERNLEKFGPVRVGLLGIGTIGRGTFDVLARNREEITRRGGRSIVITRVADVDVERARTIVGDHAKVCGDGAQIVADPDIDIVVELIGGYTIAKDLVLAAIANGKHVV